MTNEQCSVNVVSVTGTLSTSRVLPVTNFTTGHTTFVTTFMNIKMKFSLEFRRFLWTNTGDEVYMGFKWWFDTSVWNIFRFPLSSSSRLDSGAGYICTGLSKWTKWSVFWNYYNESSSSQTTDSVTIDSSSFAKCTCPLSMKINWTLP